MRDLDEDGDLGSQRIKGGCKQTENEIYRKEHNGRSEAFNTENKTKGENTREDKQNKKKRHSGGKMALMVTVLTAFVALGFY